ncbi:MAG: NADH-quinone oxidoreductase subunit N [Gammaproteobacteria bacterium]|jgi:NADH-quinone oxidoreductase subunit N|nr:NADH-quinone oxidoreductase subunit N [Gammaproteobacteria bacterium]MBT3858723.1 NADH-quinone oxidoreductase subunit N [Gammaproteobacteria bacterium]MBT3986075.1 NADH-quinone oxidoreductase subunit N [Gammaproteobacteria bacterium]MBT4255491.1 NADH-quinone oxidoreductase subunit N [Gammaproteobacteria bacterium]MBT4580786.1 NADH-quinone oxidoreductase subunit N [Gammaproteobacteria bacterium]
MITSFDDLLPLLPLLIATATAVIAMVTVGIRRNYLLTAAIVIIGLILTSFVAAVMMPYTNQQITPLLIVDQYSLFFVVVCCIAATFVAILSFPYFFSLDDEREEYYLMLTVAVIGAIVMVSSNHFISALLGLETLSMSLYGMVAYPLHSKESAKYPLEASVKYLVLSGVATGFIVFGMSLIYAQTGSLAFSDLTSDAAQMNSLGENYTVVALLMIVAGMAFKLSLAPFHVWTPDVYEGSPLPATTFLATVGKAAMFVVLLRFVTISNALEFESVVTVFSLIAVASILAGNLLALLQDNIKRILAYSSIAHMGYLLIAIIAGQGTISNEAITYYLLAYVIMTLGAFAITSVVSSSEKEFDSIMDYTGLFWRNPWLSASFIAMLLSLAGIPLTVGFIGKFYIFMSGVESGLWGLLIALVIGSGIGLYYYLRIVYRMLLPVEEGLKYRIAGIESITAYGVISILVFLLLLFGIYPAPLMSLIESVSSVI